MKKLIVLALFALLVGLAACAKTDAPPADNKAETKTSPAEPTTPASTKPTNEPVPAEPTATPATASAAGGKADAKPPLDKPLATDANKPSNLKPGIYAHFRTNMGNFTAELNDKEAPIAVANFVGLAGGTLEWTDPKTGAKQKKPYYDGLTFHRIIGSKKMAPDGFMIQGGDPLGNGTGGPGFTIKDEYNNLKHDKPGTLAMARTGLPDSAGSQFYITLGAPTFLDGQRPPYVVFGLVNEGLDVVKKIGEVQTDSGDKPLSPVVINKIIIERVK